MLDDVYLYIFVRHEAFDSDGNCLPNDGSYFPERIFKKSEEKAKLEIDLNSNPFIHKSEIDKDPALSDSISESDIDYSNDEEEENPTVHIHRFTVDFIARYPDQ